MLEGLKTSHVSDAMDELGLPENAAVGFQAFAFETAIAGYAFTLVQERLPPGGEGQTQHAQVVTELASPGDILVIDAAGITDIATWGEAHTLRALARELSGVVIHGATRDSQAIDQLGLPLMCRGASPMRSKTRFRTAALGTTISIGGATVGHRDFVIADPDGIVSVPKNVQDEVLRRALMILKSERTRDRALRNAALGTAPHNDYR